MLLHRSSVTSWLGWQVITVITVSALLRLLKRLLLVPPPLHPDCIQLSGVLVHAECLGFIVIFCPLLPPLMEQLGARMSYEGSTLIGKLEELSLSVSLLELLGGVCSGGSGVDRDSTLSARQPQSKAVDGAEKWMGMVRDWRQWWYAMHPEYLLHY